MDLLMQSQFWVRSFYKMDETKVFSFVLGSFFHLLVLIFSYQSFNISY